MMSHCWKGLASAAVAFVVAVPVTAAPAPRPPSPLAQVPAQAAIVIHIHGVERTQKHFLAMMKDAMPDLVESLASRVKEFWNRGVAGRELKGLAPDGPIFVVITELPQQVDDIRWALLARVTDYEGFLKGILTEEEHKALKKDPGGYQETVVRHFEAAGIESATVYFQHRKGYAIMTSRKEVAEQFCKQQPGLDGKLSKDVAKRLLEADLAAYVDMQAVNHEYGDQIKSAWQSLQQLLDLAGSQGGVGGQSRIEMAKKVYGGLFQLGQESRSLLVSADFQPHGLALHAQAAVGTDTASASILKQAKPAALSELGKLSPGQMTYVQINVDPGLAQAFQPWLTGVLSGGEADKTLKATLEELTKASPEGWLADSNMPFKGLQVAHYKEPAKAVAAQLKLLKALEAGASYSGQQLKAKPVLKANARTHRGFKLHRVSMEWDFEKFANIGPGGKDLADLMKKMIGTGIKVWFGTDGKIVVGITAQDWASAQKMFDHFLDGKNTVGQNPAFQHARKHLPAQGTMAMLMDVDLVAQLMERFMEVGIKAAGLPIELSNLKGDQGKSYAGVVVTLQPGRGSSDLWIPGTAMAAVRMIFQPVVEALGKR